MKFKKHFSLLMIVFLLAGLALSGCSSSESAADGSGDGFTSYEGKTLEVLVPFGPGGGTDTFARFLSKFLQEHVKGNPAVQVVNKGGGGSITGANAFVSQRDHNGLYTMISSASTHAPYFLGMPSVKYEFKEMEPIAALTSGGVVYTSPSTGIKEPKDILNPNEKLVYAGISATGMDLLTLLAFEILDMDVETIFGYEGRGPARVAFERGESNIDYQTSTAYINNVAPLVENGKAAPLFSFGQLNENGEIVRDPAFPDLPSLKEFYVKAYGEEPSGNAWEAYKTFVASSLTVQKVLWVHGDAPEESIQALKKGAKSLQKDSQFQSKGETVLGGYDLHVAPEVEKVVSNMLNASDDVLKWLRNFLKENYNVQTLGQ